MKRTRCAVGVGALCLTWVAPTGAQVPDHLKCYKVKDPQAKTTYTADLAGLVAEPGCTIKVPAIMACVPASKTNVQPMPPGLPILRPSSSGAPDARDRFVPSRRRCAPPTGPASP